MPNHTPLFKRLGLLNHPRFVAKPPAQTGTTIITSHNPATGQTLAGVRADTRDSYARTLDTAERAFRSWRSVPAPVRGQLIRALGDAFRAHKADLGMLVSLEVGKIIAEGQGEIQEIVDIADFAVGLSRQLPGHVFPSERAGHRIIEQWLPLGPIGVISAFNFPAAVWAWNATLAAVCGNPTIWKPSLLAPLTALACNAIASRVAADHGHPDIFQLLLGTDEEIAKPLVADKRLPLISATGSTRMGRAVGQAVAARLGRSLLELGGNNAVILAPDADLKLAIPSIVFGAVGTAGQRCTTTRRLIVHEKIANKVCTSLVNAYAQVITKIGNPARPGTLVGPLINAHAVASFEHAIAAALAQGGTILAGGARVKRPSLKGGHYVQPTIIRAPATNQLPVAQEETFAPILYIFTYKTTQQAIDIQNSVPVGLSSAMFTESYRTAEAFLNNDGSGSDCGIANINCGTSGAEIGGAFGGEKETGGGRESGSDSWKIYMRRQTSTLNFSGTIQLAQGISFQ